MLHLKVAAAQTDLMSKDQPFMHFSDLDFKRFSLLVYERCGINLHQRRKELVRARVSRRLREAGFEDFKTYYRFVTREDGGDELVRLLDTISTNLTSFFREEKHFDFLRQKVFPNYTTNRRENGPLKLRFWSAGCSSGEEPYSLAMLLLEYLGEDSDCDVKILATDISTKVLAQAERGVYPMTRLERIPVPVVRKYFRRGYGKQEGYFRVKPLVREMVRFRRFNLIEPLDFQETFDIILCRNVMIYFDRTTQEDLANRLYEGLVHGGYLFIGHSEALIQVSHRFTYVRPGIYQKL